MSVVRKINLCEVTRMEMIRAAKIQSPDRFLKRNNYSTRDFKNVNFKKLMIDDEFLTVLRVGDYVVSVHFYGAFEELQYLVRSMRGPNRVKRLSKTVVQEALSRALDTEDLHVGCSCADFKFRFRYYATQKDYLFGKPEEHRHPKYKKTNMDDDRGYVCKHILAVLYGKRWVPFAAKAWLEYMQANPEITEDYLWPNRRRRKNVSDETNVDSNPKVENEPETKPEDVDDKTTDTNKTPEIKDEPKATDSNDDSTKTDGTESDIDKTNDATDEEES